MPSSHPSQKPSSLNAPASVSAKKNAYVFDSFALLALLQKEKGQTQVAELVAQTQENDTTLYLSLINWGEILYITEREHGARIAETLMQDIDRLPIALMDVNRARVASAARIKGNYAVSYADAFAIALAQELNATLVTGDPECKAIENQVTIMWLEG